MFFSLLTLCSFIFNLKVIKILKKKLECDILVNEVVTSAHSLVICFLSCHFLNYHNYYFYKSMMIYSIGHLLADAFYFHYILDINKCKYLYILHHTVFIFSWYLSLLYPEDLDAYCILLFSEISITPLNIKSYFKRRNNKNMELLCGFITYILFFRYRIINYTYYNYIFYYKGYNLVLYFFTPLLGLQYYWFILMTKKIIDRSNIIPNLLHIC